MNTEQMIPDGWFITKISRTPWGDYQVELAHTHNGYISVTKNSLNDGLKQATSVAREENIRKIMEGEK